jgi:hypothetical protein
MEGPTDRNGHWGASVCVNWAHYDLEALCALSPLVVSGTVAEILPPKLSVTRRSEETGWLEVGGRKLFLNRDEVSVYRTALLRTEETFRNALSAPPETPLPIYLPGGTAWDELRRVNITCDVTPLPFDLSEGEQALLFLCEGRKSAGLPRWHVMGEEAKYHRDGEGGFVRKQVFPHHEGPCEVLHPLPRVELMRLLMEHPWRPAPGGGAHR